MKLLNLTVLIKGAGEVASGVAHRLHNSHFNIVLTEIEKPLAVSRGTSFCEAVWDGKKTIEGVTAELIQKPKIKNIMETWENNNIPLIIDSKASIRFIIKPDIIVDATMIKKKNSTNLNDAPLVIGLGPGFYAGGNVHMVIETFQNNDLGKVIYNGEALPDNGLPVEIGGLGAERVIWSEYDGTFLSTKNIGDCVDKGEAIASIDNKIITAPLRGWLRGLLRSNVFVNYGTKLIEIDHINSNGVANDIRNKMRAIGGGVLEAIMVKYNN